MESFFSLLQKNVLNRRRWPTRDQLRLAIITWIEKTYHRRRRQDRLGRLTPIEFETLLQTAHAAMTAPTETSQSNWGQTQRMNVKADPPPGLIVHTHYERDGHAHVLDVWQSRVQYEMFRNERLLPAMMEVAAQHGLDLGDGPPEPTIIDAHDFVLGR